MNRESLLKLLTEALKVADRLLSLIISKKETVPPTIPPPVPTPVPPNNLLNTMALAVQRHEGWILNPPSRSVRNNNPGNTRYSRVGYAPKYGKVLKDKDNFAIFKDYETGFMYLKNLILEKAANHPNANLMDFFGNETWGWAPPSDNNDSDRYARVVAAAMRVDPKTWQLRNLL